MRIRGRMGPLGPTSGSAVGVTRRSVTWASGTSMKDERSTRISRMDRLRIAICVSLAATAP